MSSPSTMPLMRSWSFVLFVIVFASVRISLAAKLSLKPDYSNDMGNFSVITKKDALELKCSIDEEGFTITWKKNDVEIKDGITVSKSDGKEISTLKILKATDENAGTYECSAKVNTSDPGETALKQVVEVISLPVGVLDSDGITVVEGEKLTLDCNPSGVPTPKVSWILGENTTLNGSNDRIKLLPNKNNISNAVLEIRDVKMTDRGDYKCILSNTATVLKNEDVVVTAKVRVKDKLAALWPFLGICAEVFVLCAIIFIYEKKRNKAELDESDTDNSPEQKNTPDHGKDSVRQRK